jgi:hypothetical protein
MNDCETQNNRKLAAGRKTDGQTSRSILKWRRRLTAGWLLVRVRASGTAGVVALAASAYSLVAF